MWAEDAVRAGVPAAAAMAGSAAAATAVAPAMSMSRRRVNGTASGCTECIGAPWVCGARTPRKMVDGGTGRVISAAAGPPAPSRTGRRAMLANEG
ncbi:hypothetical protein DLM46_35010 [Paraburkholderia lacunae]|uniref:Uncharacterized protein n=1 Tax=Paraburkholderia lacunae TaxID=2211104 RepID=A0A370MXD7_9BURK|nr:hypothetical protein DLM46_35010 [Paraburkholderia lacunae]